MIKTPDSNVPSTTCSNFSRCQEVADATRAKFPNTSNYLANVHMGLGIALSGMVAQEKTPAVDSLCGEGCPQWVPEPVEPLA